MTTRFKRNLLLGGGLALLVLGIALALHWQARARALELLPVNTRMGGDFTLPSTRAQALDTRTLRGRAVTVRIAVCSARARKARPWSTTPAAVIAMPRRRLGRPVADAARAPYRHGVPRRSSAAGRDADRRRGRHRGGRPRAHRAAACLKDAMASISAPTPVSVIASRP